MLLVNHKICITKLWALRSYFLYSHGFSRVVFHWDQQSYFLEHTFFNLLQTFQTDWIESSTQYSKVKQNSCSVDYHVSCHLRKMDWRLFCASMPRISPTFFHRFDFSVTYFFKYFEPFLHTYIAMVFLDHLISPILLIFLANLNSLQLCRSLHYILYLKSCS